MQQEMVFPYQPKALRLVPGIILFGAGAFVEVHKAETNTRGLIINHMIELRPSEATGFYWTMAGLSWLFFVVLILSAAWFAMAKKTAITLRPTEMIVPPVGFRSRTIMIPYADIAAIQHRKLRRQEFLIITRHSGKAAHIVASMFPSRQVFAQIRAELAARARSAQNL